MKITIKQLRKIIKEELESAVTGTDNLNTDFDIDWGKGEVTDLGRYDDYSACIEYPVTITHGDIKLETIVKYDAEEMEPIIEELVQVEGEEDVSEELMEKMLKTLRMQASSEEYINFAKDDISNYQHDMLDREESFEDPYKGMR